MRRRRVAGRLSAVSWPDALPAADVRPKRELHAGATFVPIWRDLKQRANLGEKGCYGGVDYVVERVSIDGEDAFEAAPGATLTVRPAYPLVRRLERVWPVDVREDEIPVALSSADYTALTGVGFAGVAAAWLAIAGFLATQVGGLVEVPTLSMTPTIEPGDTLVVERVTPRFRTPSVGDVVVFDAPAALKRVSGNSKAQLYVKRVAAVAGDRVRVDDEGGVSVNGAPRRARPATAFAISRRRARNYDAFWRTRGATASPARSSRFPVARSRARRLRGRVRRLAGLGAAPHVGDPGAAAQHAQGEKVAVVR